MSVFTRSDKVAGTTVSGEGSGGGVGTGVGSTIGLFR